MNTFFVKRTGKLYGPFTIKQLANCINRGFFQDSDNVSSDQINWKSVRIFIESQKLNIGTGDASMESFPVRNENPSEAYIRLSPVDKPPAENHSVPFAIPKRKQQSPYAAFWYGYADFSGRSRRTEFWIPTLINTLIMCAIPFMAVLPFGILGSLGTAALWILFYLAVFLPNLAVTVRRLHDTNRSGWFVLLPLFPLIGGIVLLVFLCTDGTRGVNQYGADPKQ